MAVGDARVDLSADGGVTAFSRLDATSANFSGDANANGQLEVGETWRRTFTTTPLADTTLTATGFGTGARGRIVTFPADAEERSALAVVVTPPTSPPTTTPPTTAPPTTAPPGTVPPAPSLPATGAPSSSDETGIAGVAFLVVGLASSSSVDGGRPLVADADRREADVGASHRPGGSKPSRSIRCSRACTYFVSCGRRSRVSGSRWPKARTSEGPLANSSWACSVGVYGVDWLGVPLSAGVVEPVCVVGRVSVVGAASADGLRRWPGLGCGRR